MSAEKWRRLSVREGQVPADGLTEGVPAHLQPSLVYWLQDVFGYRTAPARGGVRTEFMLKVASSARLVIRVGLERELQTDIIGICLSDEMAFLDTIDAALENGTSKGDQTSLNDALQVGGSAWRVASDGKSLQRRVDETTQRGADEAMQPADIASEDLRQAWAASYGRDPDASDAWDHAIKAVEAVLIPIVVPGQDKPHMGHVLGQLSQQGQLYRFVLPGADESHSVDVLNEMLGRLWPNPDRHSSGTRRTPTLAEAQAVVHLAITLVQWGRSGALTRR